MKFINTEKVYPAVIGITISLLTLFFLDVTNLPTNFDKILDAAITFSSIVTGFLGALIAIIFSIKDTEIVNFLFEHTNKKVFLAFFRNTVIAGLLIVLTSAILYIRSDIRELELFTTCKISIVKVLLVLWSFLSSYFILASYRIIDLIMTIIGKDKTLTESKPQYKKLSENEVNKLKDEFSS